MVDAYAAAVAHHRTQQFDEGREAAGAQPVRRVTADAPCLAVAVERIRRRAQFQPGQHRLRPGRGLGAAGIEAHRQVGDQADAHAGSARLLLHAGPAARGQPLREAVQGRIGIAEIARGERGVVAQRGAARQLEGGEIRMQGAVGLGEIGMQLA